MTDLKSYFHNRYQGGEDFINNVIIPIFGEDKYEDAYGDDILENNPELTTMARSTGIAKIQHLGTIEIEMNPIFIYDITVDNHVQMKRNRVAVQQLIRSIMSTYSGSFMVFHYNDDEKWDWRFTFCNKLGNNDDITDSKRYTFLLGPDQSCRTAAENFRKLADKGGDIELEDIVKAFDVEALSAEFFQKYKEQYEKFVAYITGKKYVKSSEGWQEKEFNEPHAQMYADFGHDDKRVRDYIKKLLGRIVFLYFLQKKGWLGATDSGWTNGPQNFMSQLFGNATAAQKSNFLDEILEPLYNCLDTPLRCRAAFYDTKVEGLRSVRIPFLGGLFERTSDDKVTSQFPEDYFAGLFRFLDEYNFTIDENDPDDAQVGVDPEMLGRIFENLLEDNKDKGAFYTPKEIVQYMCRESLIAYLQTGVTDEPTREALRQFVTTHDVSRLGGKNSPLAENVSRCLRHVKICDPAIGSGAFPIGLLNELFLCRGVIEDFSNATSIKRHIIQQNIYGVDIERGAVEIARLRFWLSIVADAETPDLLPNLDFKIMQGNSLLESYNGFDLSRIMETKHVLETNHQYSIFEDDIDVIRAEVKKLIQNYYTEDDSTQRSAMRQSIKDKIQRQIEKGGYQVDIMQVEDISATSDFFLWHTWFSEVFEEGGFDIVIGNPPYIQLQGDEGKLGELYKPCKFDTFKKTGDIYCLFYEKGCELLKSNGHLCFITSNKWMRAGYGDVLRGFLANKTNPMLLIDFAGVKIFSSATVDTNILLFAKSANEHKTLCAIGNKQEKNSIKNLSLFVQQNSSVCEFSNSDSWVILSPVEQSIKRKIEAVGTPLKDWDIQINYGIKTGYNEAFIISTEKRDEILANCQSEDERTRTAELIRPILRGRDIKRYGYEWAGLWLIYIPWHFPLQFDETITGASEKAENAFREQYPAVYQHMLEYKEPLSKRNKAETGIRYEWYAMQRWGAKYWEDFNKPKLFYADITQQLNFCFCRDIMFCNNTTYFIASKNENLLRHLQRYLNSPLIDWYYRTLSVQLGEKAVRMFSIYVLEIPIPPISQDNIYKAYKLSASEIEYIESKSD